MTKWQCAACGLHGNGDNLTMERFDTKTGRVVFARAYCLPCQDSDKAAHHWFEATGRYEQRRLQLAI